MKKILLVAFGISLGISVLGMNPLRVLADAVSDCTDDCDATAVTCQVDCEAAYSIPADVDACIADCVVEYDSCSTLCGSAASISCETCQTDSTACTTAVCGDPLDATNTTYSACALDCSTGGKVYCLLGGICTSTAAAPTTTAPVTSKENAVDAATKAAAASYWYSLVPPDCQEEGGCNICQITLIFTNAANIIGAILSALALLMFILGGMLLIFSAGVESRVELGKKILIGTVSGLAIVFLAWFVVNLIVRLAASSATTPNGLPSTTRALIFSSDWWNPPSCEPPLPSLCAGLPIGSQCGGKSATGTDCPSTDPIACSCFRKKDPAGDSDVCGGDTDNTIGTAQDVAGNKKKQCYCASGCTQYAIISGEPYVCTSSATVTTANAASPGSWITASQRSCPTKDYVCAKPK